MHSAIKRLARVLPSAMLGAALALTAVAPAAKAAPVDADPTPWAAPANGESAATITPDTEVDPSTIADWRKWIESESKLTTNNVGRVWTDKSVYNDDLNLKAEGEGITIQKGDDDFLVTLSALSSYSNLTSKASKPLDIVLMLDMSGSMNDRINTYRYDAVYNLGNGPYYIKLEDGTYREVKKAPISGNWYYGRLIIDQHNVEPKTSADDTTPGRYQFYDRTSLGSQKRIAALRDAVEGFVNSTAKANAAIGNPDLRHHVSIAKFAGEQINREIANDRNMTDGSRHYTQRITALEEIDNQNKDGIIAKMRSVDPLGPTAADSALGFSKEILDGALEGDATRANAQKVVIFFTDGQPNHDNDFDVDVANGAIANSKALKDSGAMVYTIGMFEGANPSDTGDQGEHRFNSYMNGVSSNYPNATEFTSLGERVSADKDYYYAADDAEQLDKIFQSIFTEIEQQMSGSPTYIEGNDPTKGGYITFEDELGSYMTVSSFKKVLFAGNAFDQVEKVENADGSISYTFRGTYASTDSDSPYKTIDLSDIIITVVPGKDAKTGDHVTVKIPAADIPISKFKITEENGAAEFEHVQAYPLVVSYGVSVKPAAMGLIANPDANMKAYILENTTADGKLSFYSNAFDKGATDGKTTASFTPSMGNNFNRFVSDTPLYADSECTVPAGFASLSPDTTTYYYKRSHYTKDAAGSGAHEEVMKIALKHGPEESVLDVRDAGGSYKYVAEDADGNAYIKAGAPRIQRVSSDISTNKASNPTGTALTSNNPYWMKNEGGEYDHITINLGNNGKKVVQLPGSLAVTKSATVAAGSFGPMDKDGKSTLGDIEFPIKVSVTGLGDQKVFAAAVTNASGDIVSDPDMQVDLTSGSYTQSIKNGETFFIYGLPENAMYTVEEPDMPAGFSLKSVTDSDGKTAEASGSIVAGTARAITLNNEYRAAATEPATGLFTAKKNFDGWDSVKEDASFDIRMIANDWPGKADGVDPVFPTGSNVVDGQNYKYVAHIVSKHDANRDKAFSFGDISFDRMGTYTYTIGEYIPADSAEGRLPGVNYSNERYRVTVVVKDDGLGKLAVDPSQSKMEELTTGKTVEAAQINNMYALDSASAELEGYKSYTDATGGNPLNATKFTFAITPIDGAPAPMYYRDGAYTEFEKLDDTAYPGAYKAQNYQNGDINLGTMVFTKDHILDGGPTTYVYKLQEVKGSDIGMTYDETICYAHVTAAVGTDGASVSTSVRYTKDEEGNDPAETSDGRVVFTNSYFATPAAVKIQGEKTLVGRNMLDGEEFGFTLGAADQVTEEAVAKKVVSFGDTVESVGGASNGKSVGFAFNGMTIAKVGTYTFEVRETGWNGEPIPADGTKGMTFDRGSRKVTVEVSLDRALGALTSKVTYDKGDAASFKNTYKASTGNSFTGLTVAKTLTGRTMKPKDFAFKIEALDGAPQPDAQDTRFTNMMTRESGQVELIEGKLSSLSFDQDDAGKPFKYRVSEERPENAVDQDPQTAGFQYKGVTYDDSVYTLSLVPRDNGDGTMAVDASVSNAEGSEVAKAARVSFANTYAATGALDGAADLKGTKSITGIASSGISPEGYTFQIVHSDADGNAVEADPAVIEMPEPSTATSSKDGSFAFGDIVFHKPGTYYFTVSEVVPAKDDKVPGITYGDKKVLVVVFVTDNGYGTLTATKSSGTPPLAFANTYTPTPIVLPGSRALKVRKVLDGREWLDGEAYSFEISAKTDGAPMPAGGNTITLSKGTQAAGFGDISFSKPGTYEYKIVETGISADKNLTFSQAEYELVATVDVDGSSLTLETTMTRVKDDESKPANEVVEDSCAVFTNTYKAPTQLKDVMDAEDPQTSIDGKLVKVGTKLEYVITWANDAIDAAGKAVSANVSITDKLPSGTTFVTSENGVYNEAEGTVTWDLGLQDPNASGTVKFTVEVTDAAVGDRVNNTAVIKIGDSAPKQTTTPEVFVPGKSVADENQGEPQVGDKLIYTVSYANLGEASAKVTIVDKLPVGITYVEGSASEGGSYDAGNHVLTWTLDGVAANTTGSVRFEALVNDKAVTGKDPVTNKATVQLGDDPAVETNSTSTEVKTGTLTVTKNIALTEGQGTELDAGKEFEFRLALKDASGSNLGGEYAIDIAGAKSNIKDGGTFKLKHGQTAGISGLPAGAKYAVTEAKADGYTTSSKGADGTITADGTSEAVFTNTYGVGSTTLAAKDGFKAKKVLEGRDWMVTDVFEAKLVAVDNAPMPDGAKDGALVKQMTKDAKEVLFGDIKYAAAGEYSYTISEEVGSIGGIKYSDTIYNVKVKVTDKGDGTLAASFDGKYVVNGAAEDASPTDIAKFVNVYSAAVPQGSPVTTANLFSKVLTGRDWKKDDSFSFTITPLNGAPAPEHLEVTLTGRTTAAGDAVPFDFGAINFTFDHIKDAPVVNGFRTKDFVYEVRETQGDIAGVKYDDNKATLTIRLTDAGDGNLTATYNVTGESQFTNEYSTEPVNPDGDGATSKAGIQIVKTLTGRPIAAGDFEFTMAPDDDATKEKFGDAKVIATNAAELGIGELSNTAIGTTPVATGLEFTLADVGKTYKFELSETKGGGTGYVNDQTVHALTFTTADNRNGTLSVAVFLDGKEAAVWTSGAEVTPVSIGFANSYSAGSITVGGQGGVALAGTKQLTGRPMVAGEFHFNVTNAKDQTKPAAVVATGTNAADGTITFTGIEYTTEKLNNDVAAGLATVDRTGDSGDVYTYTYNVSEDATKNDQGISVIQGTQPITVKVTDNRKGQLSAEVVYPEGGMVFKNAYGTGADGTKVIALNGTKVLDVKSGNKVPDIAGKYTFELTGSEGAPMPAKTTATNDDAGNISFGEITYTMENVFGAPVAKSEQPAVVAGEPEAVAADASEGADASTAETKATEADAKADDAVAAEAEAKPVEDESAAKAAAADEPMVASAQRSKTFTYTVTESGSVAGVTNDPVATKTITVKVTDNGDGTLSVDKQAESAATDFTFTNTYSVKPSESTLTGEGGFTITKTLDGRELREGEFEFALASQAEDEQTVVTAKNDANGKVAIPAISFNAPGEYRYRLAEVDGGLGGVTYDTTVYDVTATVVDNGDGTLGVTWSVSKDGKALEGKEIVFANSYKAAGTSITFNAAKVLTGRELKKGEFTFELRDANGKVLQTVKNGALTEGGYAPIAFDPITYDEPGTYDYRIVEVKGDAEGITYDETVFTYHVVVTDDGNGQLQVEWTVGETGAPVFQNVYVKPEDPKPADPAKPADPGNGGSGDKLIQTGDNALVGMFAAAFAGMAAIGAGFTARRKKK